MLSEDSFLTVLNATREFVIRQEISNSTSNSTFQHGEVFQVIMSLCEPNFVKNLEFKKYLTLRRINLKNGQIYLKNLAM